MDIFILGREIGHKKKFFEYDAFLIKWFSFLSSSKERGSAVWKWLCCMSIRKISPWDTNNQIIYKQSFHPKHFIYKPSARWKKKRNINKGIIATHRIFFDLRKHLGLQTVFKSPEFTNDSKNWDPRLQTVFKSPEFTNDSKS